MHRLGPYHVARFKALSASLKCVVLELSSVDRTYAWDEAQGEMPFLRETLFTDDDIDRKGPAEIRRRLIPVLERLRPSVVVIPGWSSKACLAALQWCRRGGTPGVLMSESTELDFPRNAIQEWLKSKVVRQFSAALVGGNPHRKYAEKLGIPPDRIWLGYDVVDNDYFDSRSCTVAQRAETPYFLASCRFVEKKNLIRLLKAYFQYRDMTSEPWDLVVLGDGPQRAELERMISTSGASPHVRFPGFKQYGELPEFYGAASAFIHASSAEQWGLVVNEAMACGLPVLVSDRCGCAADLVIPGVNGFRFAPADVSGLSAAMKALSDDSTMARKMGDASREIIAHWTPQHFAQGLGKAIHAAMTRGSRAFGPLDRLALAAALDR